MLSKTSCVAQDLAEAVSYLWYDYCKDVDAQKNFGERFEQTKFYLKKDFLEIPLSRGHFPWCYMFKELICVDRDETAIQENII